MTSMATDEFLQNIDSLYENDVKMHKILNEILKTLSEMTFFGPLAKNYITNISAQKAVLSLAMTYASDAHELERKGDRDNALMCVRSYGQLLEVITNLDARLDKMRKNNG